MGKKIVFYQEDHGFSIIEIILFVALLAILLTIAVSSVASRIPHFRLTEASRNISADFQLARMKAISTNKTYGVGFESSSPHYIWVFVDKNNNNQYDGGDTIQKSVSLPEGIEYVSNTFQNGTALFYPDGSSNGGAITLKNTLLENRSVSVTVTTGRVKIL